MSVMCGAEEVWKRVPAVADYHHSGIIIIIMNNKL